jgi:hypothetical protein
MRVAEFMKARLSLDIGIDVKECYIYIYIYNQDVSKEHEGPY